MNNLVINGRLTKEPELSYTSNGNPMAKFCIANNEGWGDNKVTTFFSCVQWGKGAEATGKYCSKGQRVLASGAVVEKSYTDKEGNQKKYLEFTVRALDFLDRKLDDQQSGNKQQDNEYSQGGNDFTSNPWEKKGGSVWPERTEEQKRNGCANRTNMTDNMGYCRST